MAIRDRVWQIDKSRFRHSLAGVTVTIHEHLDETVSIRYGPHVVGRYSGTGESLIGATPKKRRGKGGSMEAGENQEQVFTGSHLPGNLAETARFPLSHRDDGVILNSKIKAKPKPKRRPNGLVALFHKADRSRMWLKRTTCGQLDLLTTPSVSRESLPTTCVSRSSDAKCPAARRGRFPSVASATL